MKQPARLILACRACFGSRRRAAASLVCRTKKKPDGAVHRSLEAMLKCYCCNSLLRLSHLGYKPILYKLLEENRPLAVVPAARPASAPACRVLRHQVKAKDPGRQRCRS